MKRTSRSTRETSPPSSSSCARGRASWKCTLRPESRISDSYRPREASFTFHSSSSLTPSPTAGGSLYLIPLGSFSPSPPWSQLSGMTGPFCPQPSPLDPISPGHLRAPSPKSSPTTTTTSAHHLSVISSRPTHGFEQFPLGLEWPDNACIQLSLERKSAPSAQDQHRLSLPQSQCRPPRSRPSLSQTPQSVPPKTPSSSGQAARHQSPCLVCPLQREPEPSFFGVLEKKVVASAQQA